MTTLVEYIPVTPIEYPDEDGKPMAEGDIQCSYLTYARNALRIYFQNHPNVYVAGNLFIYYEKGYPESVVAPDVFVVFGVENRDRRSYKTWEENNQTPAFVLEITSKSTRSKDQGAKKGIYAFLGVREYFQYDPTGDYLNPQLQGLHLVDGNYFPLATNTLPDGTVSLPSEVLGLELHLEAGKLRFYNPATGQILLTHEEEAAARQAAEEKTQRLAAKLRELNIDPDRL
ncbi:Uma2 family endonuclease [Nostoc sp. CHAB 5836]|uniref:Uma2 family endonuclease n=1 Tax=Nostoc sp. CHAB 5836 TaxID=2780404 RepID=UPI001E5D2468|nr:Uma2 family endonuclease [Nostoc sp. CHAB 5836]MCC5617343.1 Uma2 family endonuclease [Nostoc sp. CHAB 5836]